MRLKVEKYEISESRVKPLDDRSALLMGTDLTRCKSREFLFSSDNIPSKFRKVNAKP